MEEDERQSRDQKRLNKGEAEWWDTVEEEVERG
jgi:hypothetical protein